MNKYIFLIISFILDFVLLNVLPFSYLNISYLQPLFLVISVSLIYKLFNSDKQYFITIVIVSILYGSLFMNNILLGMFLLLLVGMITKFYNKYINLNNFTIIIEVISIIILYEFLIYLITNISFITFFSINNLLYKISHSIIINLIYVILIYNLYIKKVLKKTYS